MDDGCAAVVEGSCCWVVEEAGAAALVGAACDVGVSDVAGDAAAAGEVFTEAEAATWRTFSAAACSLSIRSP